MGLGLMSADFQLKTGNNFDLYFLGFVYQLVRALTLGRALGANIWALINAVLQIRSIIKFLNRS